MSISLASELESSISLLAGEGGGEAKGKYREIKGEDNGES